MSPVAELRLHEILSDPIIRLLMERDGVTSADVERVVKEFHARRTGTDHSPGSEVRVQELTGRLDA